MRLIPSYFIVKTQSTFDKRVVQAKIDNIPVRYGMETPN